MRGAAVAAIAGMAVLGIAFAPWAQAMLVPGLVVDATTPAGQTRADCADVLFLGARGSGQPQAGSSADGGTGLGPQVNGVAQRLVQDLPGRSVSVSAVEYPAAEAQLLVLDPATYFGGLEQGVATVTGTLRSQAAVCPQQRLVLAGYSQGAMVMHRVLQDLASSDPSSTAILARLDGAVLIADGDRSRKDRTTNYGTAGRSRGISYALRSQSGVRGTLLPKRLKSRVHSICADADIVCDYRSLLQSNAAGVDGGSVHVLSYTDSADVNRATDAVAARLS